jgi:hypothetical protein
MTKQRTSLSVSHNTFWLSRVLQLQGQRAVQKLEETTPTQYLVTVSKNAFCLNSETVAYVLYVNKDP